MLPNVPAQFIGWVPVLILATGKHVEEAFCCAGIATVHRRVRWGKEPTDLDIARVLTEFVPLSKSMAEQITGLRNWSKGRARLATSQPSERKLRRIAA